MKTRIVLYLVFMLCILSAVAGREKYGSFTKYEDKKNGYSGWACADYLGTTKETDAYKEMQELISGTPRQVHNPCSKLTNEESFLMWSALADYNYKKGEVYYVEIRDKPDARGVKNLILFITITGKDTLEWYGYYTYHSR